MDRAPAKRLRWRREFRGSGACGCAYRARLPRVARRPGARGLGRAQARRGQPNFPGRAPGDGSVGSGRIYPRPWNARRGAASAMKIANAAALAAVVGAEAILFLVTAHNHYAWSYPRWNDQTQYLGQAYGGYELARSAGYAAGAWRTMTQENAQGCLHGILALPIFAVAGPSRTAALAVNLLAFAALQLATFLAVRRISGRHSIAWASVGLLLALHFPWSGRAGSAVDFRLDWMAACAYGITLAAALAGRGFRSTRWAILLGVAVGVTVLLRFLTAVYFCLIFIALLAWLLARRERWGRCGRLAISGVVAVGIFGPVLLRNRLA